MSGFEVDPDLLDQLADTLRTERSSLEKIIDSIPGPPDVGESTDTVVNIVTHMVENVDQLIVGLSNCAEVLASAAEKYRNEDKTASEELERILGVEL